MKSEEISLIEIELKGFQLVKSVYFSRIIAPSMTIWSSAISFGTAAIEALGKCEYINLFVNTEDKKILIKPTTSKDPDAIKWIRNPNKPASIKLECTLFTRPIYEKWNLNKDCRYKAYGKLVQNERKVMLLFDFSSYEAWNGQKLIRENG